MYDIIKSVILNGNYELSNMLTKIDTIWVQSGITDEQRTELINLARTNAIPENSYAPLQNQINILFEKFDDAMNEIDTVKDRVTELEKANNPDIGDGDDDEDIETPVVDEYPEYVQPMGAHDAYNAGDKITYNGKKYICKMNGCVWNPDAYPAGWELVEDIDDTEENTENNTEESENEIANEDESNEPVV